MSLTVVGSVAFDALETPFGKREKILGGAATHFSLSASFFTQVNAVGVVGGDFGEAEWDVFKRHAINTDDVEVVADGKTFFWSGRYDYDMNTAHTLDTQLNVFETFDPKLSENSKNAKLLFLANILPMLQKQVREQCPNAEFVAMDTMNFWISSMKDAVIETIKVVDCIIINDAEARQLTDEPNIHKAAQNDHGLRPEGRRHQTRRVRCDVVHKGRLFRRCRHIRSKAFSIRPVRATHSPAALWAISPATTRSRTTSLRRAMIYGSVMASFNVEKFGTERVDALDYPEINERFRRFQADDAFRRHSVRTGDNRRLDQPQQIVE